MQNTLKNIVLGALFLVPFLAFYVADGSSFDWLNWGTSGLYFPFIEAMRKEYDTLHKLEPNPVIMTRLFEKMHPEDATVLPPIAFYPFSSHTIHTYKGQQLGKETYGVHLWNHSWAHPLNKFFKKIGIYRLGVTVTEFLGIKKILKKIFGFI